MSHLPLYLFDIKDELSYRILIPFQFRFADYCMINNKLMVKYFKIILR